VSAELDMAKPDTGDPYTDALAYCRAEFNAVGMFNSDGGATVLRHLFVLMYGLGVLYVSNEDDNLVTAIDVPTREVIAQIPTGVEPEGMAVSPDGKTIVNTSEATNMAHFIDGATEQMVASVLVDARPRVAMFKPDGSEVWVSSELGGTVSVIDPVHHAVMHKILFDVRGLRAETIQPVGIQFSRGGAIAFVALGPPSRVAVVDAKTYRVQRYLLVGQRVWRMAFTPDQKYPLSTSRLSNDISVIDVTALEVIKSIPVGRLPWGVVVSRKALQNISLTVPQSRFTALPGLNGAGTLFSLITQLYDTRLGFIEVLGHRISRDPGEALCRLGVVFQARTLDLDLSAIDNLIYHAALHGIGGREALSRALAAATGELRRRDELCDFSEVFASSALYPLWLPQQSSPIVYVACRLNPFSYAVVLIRFALYVKLDWTSLAVVMVMKMLFTAGAIIAYDPARGLIARRRGGV
jgi:PQQ-dependent catabolism-associated beta-propeller protein